MFRPLLACSTIGAVFFAVGCGGGGGESSSGGDESSARDTVEQTKSAILSGDTSTVCRNSTASFQDAMINAGATSEDEKGQPCESVLPDILDQPGHFLEGLQGATVTSIEVSDDGSEADVNFDAAFYASTPDEDDQYQVGLIYQAGQWELNKYCELSGESTGSCITGVN